MAVPTRVLRHTTTGAVEAAREHASDLVASGSERVRDSIDRGAHTFGRLTPEVPGLPRSRPPRRWGRRALLVVAVLTVLGLIALAVARRRNPADDEAHREDEVLAEGAPPSGPATPGDATATGRRTA